MSEPATFAMFASTAVSAMGSMQRGEAAEEMGEARAQAAQRQAEILEAQAAQEREAAAIEEADFRERADRIMGRQRAVIGGSGAQMTGTPLDVAADTAARAEREALKIRRQGEIRATRTEQEAELTLTEGQFAREAGETRRRGAFMRAGSQILSGAGRIFEHRQRLGETD